MPPKPAAGAVEGSGGCGSLLAQQLIDAGEHVLDAGEHVLDVPATLASTPSAHRGWHRSALRITRRCCGSWRCGTDGSARAGRAPRGASRRCWPRWFPSDQRKKIKADEDDAILDGYNPTTPAEAARRDLALEHLGDLPTTRTVPAPAPTMRRHAGDGRKPTDDGPARANHSGLRPRAGNDA